MSFIFLRAIVRQVDARPRFRSREESTWRQSIQIAQRRYYRPSMTDLRGNGFTCATGGWSNPPDSRGPLPRGERDEKKITARYTGYKFAEFPR